MRGGAQAARFAAEFGTIVVGVLVALVGQAWWETQREAQQETENLAVLAADLVSMDTTLARVVREDSTYASTIREDLVAMVTRDTTHTLQLPLVFSDYRLRNGSLERILASPGPVLDDAPRLMALLSDLDAEIRVVEERTTTMTAELFRYVRSIVEEQERVRMSAPALTPRVLLEGLGSSPAAMADASMVTVALANRDSQHRRLRALVQEVQRALEESGVEPPAEPEPVGDPDATEAAPASPDSGGGTGA